MTAKRPGPWNEGRHEKWRVVETIGQYEIHETYYFDFQERIFSIWDNDELDELPVEFETLAEARQFIREIRRPVPAKKKTTTRKPASATKKKPSSKRGTVGRR